MKKSNGVNSQSILIFIHTNKTAEDCESDVVKWFLNCLTPLTKSISNKCGQCDFKIISNIQNNDYLDENKTYNKIVIALQNGQQLGPIFDSIHDDGDLIIIDEESKKNILNPDDILNLLKEEPECVTKIGVSGVSTKCMKQYWSEMVSEEPGIFDIAGQGYMQHPMWMYIGNGWGCVREQSFNFGWENYPGSD